MLKRNEDLFLDFSQSLVTCFLPAHMLDFVLFLLESIVDVFSKLKVKEI